MAQIINLESKRENVGAETKKKTDRKNMIPGLPYDSDIENLAIELNLESYEHLLLRLLRSRMNKKQKSCWPTQKQLAKGLKKSGRQVRRYLKKFERMNIITIGKKKKSKRYGNNASEYKLNFPWEVKPDTIMSTMSAVKPDTIMSTFNVDKTDGSMWTKRTGQCGHSYDLLISKAITKSNKKMNKSSSGLDDDSFSLSSGEADNPMEIWEEENYDEDEDEDEFETAKEERENIVSSPGKKEIDGMMISWEDYDGEEEGEDGEDEIETATDRKENQVSLLKKFYGDRIPRRVDLSESSSGEECNLQEYISPFAGTKDALIKIYRTDFSDPKPVWWEDQFDAFYEEVTHYHWSKNSKPKAGFKVVFKRACVAGVMHSFGFKPKTPEQMEQEKREGERHAKLAREKKLEVMKEQAEREKRQEKLVKIFDEVKKGPSIAERLYHIGIYDIGGFEKFIEECLKNGRVKNKETIVEDLQRAIEEEYFIQLAA